MTKNRIIVVNAVASVHSGALSVLMDFIQSAIHSDFNFLIFTGIPIDIPEESNIRVFLRPNKTRFNRFCWDNYQLNKELNAMDCMPDLVFSLQNTDFKVSYSIPHVVFFHNPFMLYDINWNIFNRNERLFWFYKVVYKYIVKYSLDSQTILIVQSQWAKKSLKQRGFTNSSIKVFKGNRKIKNVEKSVLNIRPTIQLFYPATPLIYKNHKFLFDLLAYIKATDEELFLKLKLNLTISFEDILNLKLIKRYQNVKEAIILHGYVDKLKVEKLYKNTDFLIFPSLVETLGLPLLEASEYGINILAINMEYAKEVLSDYNNAVFLDCKNFQKWVEQIKHFVPKEDNEQNKYVPGDFTSWGSIFEFFNELITKYE